MDKIRIEECCEILDSQRVPITAKDRVSGPYPYYGANGIQDYIDQYIFDDELVLVAEDGGHFGSKTRPIAYRVSGKCWVNNHAHVLKPKEMIDVDYLGYSLMFYNVGNMVNGATRKKLNQKQLRQMTIPNVSLEEQKDIVKKLNSIVAIKDKRKQQLEEYDILIKSRFVEMFGDSRSNSMGYPTVKLEELGKVGSSKRVFVDELVASGIPFFRGTEVGSLAEGNEITPELFITEEHYSRMKKATGVPQIGDLLMPSICPDGRIWRVDSDGPFYFKDGRVLWVNVKSIDINCVYLQYALKDKFMNDYSNIASGTTFAELKIFALKNIDVLMPDIKIQNQYAAFINHIDKLKLEVQKSLDETQVLFDSLMQEYFE